MRCNGFSCRLERVQPCSTYRIFFAGFKSRLWTLSFPLPLSLDYKQEITRDVLLFAQVFHSSSFCIVVLQKLENKHKTIENQNTLADSICEWIKSKKASRSFCGCGGESCSRNCFHHLLSPDMVTGADHRCKHSFTICINCEVGKTLTTIVFL